MNSTISNTPSPWETREIASNRNIAYHYIPQNFDLKKHIQQHPIDHIFKFNPDHLLYILDRITTIPVFNKSVNVVNGFTPLSSTALQDKIPHYRQYIEYLINSGVIETDNQYIVEEKCKGYRFADKYRTKVRRVQNGMKIRVNKNKQEMARLKRHKDYKHLPQWYNPNLKVDYNLAYEFIEADRERKLQCPELRDFEINRYGRPEYKDP